jgi:hypothetical protein
VPDDTRELISVADFQRWLVLAATVVLVCGVAAGYIWGRKTGSPRSGLVRGAAAGLLGPVALGLWRVYNFFEDRYGLDSVRALMTNLVIFACCGAAIGVLLGWIWRRTGPGSRDATPQAGEEAGGAAD